MATFFHSVRFKLLTGYIILLTITLSIFGFLIYENFRKDLFGDLDDLLCSRAEGIVNSIDTFWHAKKTESLIPSAKDITAIAGTWVEERKKDSELMSIFVQILDNKGEIIIASRSMPRIAAINKADLDDLLNGEDDFDTLKGEDPSGKKMRYRVYYKPVYENGSVLYIVQVAGPLSLISIALNNLKFGLLILIPLTVLLAGVPGVLLAKLTLRPVDRMISTLKQITAENLKLKIHIPDTKDEIYRLAESFNTMINRLDRSFSSQQRFIQDISNELRTPLDILKKEIDNTLKSDKSAEKSRLMLEKVSEQVDSLFDVINDLLVLSRFEDGTRLLEIRKVNLKRLAEQVIEEMKVLIEQKDLSVVFHCDNAIIIDADKNQLHQLITNLLDNAIKYTNRKGEVKIMMRKKGKAAQIVVSDTGVGMPEEELTYIFDRFYQINKSRITNNGFGIGLSLVKVITESHKGTISVESTLGKGSTFTVSLPISYQG